MLVGSRFLIGLSLVLVIGAGCASLTPSGSSPSPAVFTLPTVDVRVGDPCAGIGLIGATLTGSPTDPRVAWLTSTASPGRIDIVFPAGFTAQFAPELEILDGSGQVVAREGDSVDGACDEGDGSGRLLVFSQ